jgi:hypothetical protein
MPASNASYASCKGDACPKGSVRVDDLGPRATTSRRPSEHPGRPRCGQVPAEDRQAAVPHASRMRSRSRWLFLRRSAARRYSDQNSLQRRVSAILAGCQRGSWELIRQKRGGNLRANQRAFGDAGAAASNSCNLENLTAYEHPLPGLGFQSAVTQKHAASGMMTGMGALSSAAPPPGGTQIPGTRGQLPMDPPANMQQHPPTPKQGGALPGGAAPGGHQRR